MRGHARTRIGEHDVDAAVLLAEVVGEALHGIVVGDIEDVALHPSRRSRNPVDGRRDSSRVTAGE